MPTQHGKIAELSEYPGYYVSSEGVVYSGLTPLKPRPNNKGYMRVQIAGKDRYIHRLVVSAFKGGIPEGLQVRHLDGDPSNNRLNNLRVGTQSDNELDKRRHGKDPRGSRHGQATLTEADVIEIRQLWDLGLSAKAIKQRLGLTMSESSVHGVATSISWKHVPPATRGSHIKGGDEGYRKRN